MVGTGAARARASVVITAVIVSAVLGAGLLGHAPAATAADRAISGRVDDRGVGLSGVAVGYTDPTTGVVARARTTTEGRFTIRVPAAPGTGFVWAGVEPRLRHVTFAAHGRSYVRAVIGLIRPTTGPGALFETLRPAAPDRIAGGGDVAIHLRRAAVLSGRSSAFAGFRIDLRRGDGTLVQAVSASSTGAYRSPPLAAGRYAVTLLPPGAVSPTAAPAVTLHGGRVAVLPVSSARAATRRLDIVTGIVSTPTGVASAGVRVEATQGDRTPVVVQTDRDGRYRFVGLTPGSWTILAGRNAPSFEDSPSTVPPTPDAVTAASRRVVVRSGGTIETDLRLLSAGHVTGTASSTGVVIVEDRSGRIVRTAGGRSSGSFDAGGLAPGTYTVLRLTASGFAERTVTLHEGEAKDLGDLSATRHFLTISGTLTSPRTTSAGVQVSARLQGGLSGYDTADAIGIAATTGADGRYAIRGVVPGRYTVVALAPPTRTVPTSTVVVHDASVTDDLTAGPARARVTFAGVFRTLGGPGLWYLPYSLTATDGTVQGFGGNPGEGRFTFAGYAGTTYRWERSNSGLVLASDGPWWSFPTTADLTLSRTSTTDAVIPLRILH